MWPTAQMSLGAMTVIAFKLLVFPGLGVETWLQFVPFQRSAQVMPLRVPTAHTSFDATAPTAKRELSYEPGESSLPGVYVLPVARLGTTVHCVPSQCMVSGPPGPSPTAQTSFEETAPTPLRWP